MALKGKFLREKFTGNARYIYTVHGTTAEIAEFIENQGDNVRFLQEDGSIGLEESDTPVYYSKYIVGKNPTLVWNESTNYYNANGSFEDSVLMDAARRAFTQSSDTQPVEKTETQDADLDGKEEPAKPAGNGRGPRKVK